MVNRWRAFLMGVAAVFVASYASLYAFATSPLYCAYSRNIADTAPCYKYDVAGIATDVLLIGDSALLYAIRPSEVAAANGPSVYNYGLIGPAFALDPAGVIDHYLATNRKPRAIVLYFSPWDRVEPGRITDPRWFPSAVLTLQHGGVADFGRLVRARPSAIAEIPPTVVDAVTLDTQIARERRLAMEADGGRLDFARLSGGPMQSLEGRCPGPSPQPEPIEVSDRTRRAFAELRDRYRRQGIALHIYVAPSAECDGAVAATRAAYAGVADNVPKALPDRFFTADPSHQHVHVNEEGATEASHLLAGFLAAKMTQGGAG